MNILITGAEGYLGGRLIETLSGKKYKLFLAGRRKSDAIYNLKDAEHRFFDLTDKNSISGICAQIDVVIHLAALNEIVCQKQPDLAITANIGGTYHLVQDAVAHKVKHFMYISTAHVYGAPLQGNIDEKSLTMPAHPYSITKKAAEDFVLSMSGKVPVTIFRLSNSFGYPSSRDMNRWKLIGNDLCRQAIETGSITLNSSGKQLRDFVSITDVTNAMLHAIQNNVIGLYNIGGKTLSVYDFACLVAKRYEVIHGKPASIYKKEDEGKIQSEIPLHYETSLFSSTGFTFQNEFDKEIDATLRFCAKNFTRP